MVTLRPYQETGVEILREQFRKYRAGILVQSCGSGKGTMASWIVNSAAERGRRALFLVNRRTLVYDMSKRLDEFGLDHGIIMAGTKRPVGDRMVAVASIDTLHRRSDVPPADLIIVDECRFSISPMWKAVLAKYPEAKVLGLDATPIKTDGRGLSEVYEFLVEGPQPDELIQMGYLLPSVVFAPAKPDTSGVARRNGDFVESALATVCDQKKLVGDIVKHWSTICPDRRTIAFGVNQAHAEHIAEEFRCANIQFAYVDCDTPDDERKKVWADLESGVLRGVTNVGIIGYGFDLPIISCVIQARPTESLAIHIQQVGRGARPYAGQDRFFVLDHSANVHRHGFFEDRRQWSLEGIPKKEKREKEESETSVVTCKRCFRTFERGPEACPNCGAPLAQADRQIKHVKGSLVEMHRGGNQLSLDMPIPSGKEVFVCPQCGDRQFVPRGSTRQRCNRCHQYNSYLKFVQMAIDHNYSKSYPEVMFRQIYKRPVPREWQTEALAVKLQAARRA